MGRSRSRGVRAPSDLPRPSPDYCHPVPRGDEVQLIEIGLDHATADVTVRERLAVSNSDLPGVLADLRQIAADAVVLSTCNRVEIYLLVADADSGAQRALAYFADRSGLTLEAVTAATRVR